MSQFGMSMPTGQMQRRASMNVYTGLLFLATMALLAACVFVWIQGSKIGKGGQPFELQPADAKTIEFSGAK